MEAPFGLPPSGMNRQLAAERAILRAAGGCQVLSPSGAEPLAAIPALVSLGVAWQIAARGGLRGPRETTHAARVLACCISFPAL